MTMPLTPADSSGTSAPVPADFEKPYQDAIVSAHNQYLVAFKQYQDAKDTLTAIAPAPASGIDMQDANRTHATVALDAASKVLESAGQLETNAHTAYATGVDRYVSSHAATPGLTAHYQALSDSETAAAADTKAKTAEWLNQAPDRAVQLHATTQETTANATLAQAKADLANATLPAEKQKAQIAVDQAQASLDSTQATNKQAGLQNTITAAKAANAPAAEAATTSSLTSKATIDSADAANASATSLATLTKAQADAGTANVTYQDALANFNALTPDMRTQAAQDALDTKHTALLQAQQTLKYAEDSHQTVMAQGQATLAQTQATTSAGLLGPLYGAQQKADEIAAMLKAGTITDPAQAHQMLQDYITSAMRGTTPFEQQNTALSAETARRQQDSSLAGTQSTALGSIGGSLFSSMASANKDAPAGSTAMAQSYGGIMGAIMDQFKGMRGNVAPANSPLLNSMSTGGGVAPPAVPMAPPAPAPAAQTTIAPDGTVTIAHTPTNTTPVIPPTPTIPLLGPGQAGTSADPMAGGAQNPAFLGGMGLAMPAHVDALWQNDPNLNPLNSQSLAA